MELNRRTKLAGGVLALAVAGLIYDRVLAGGPASAEAAPVKAAEPSAPPSPNPESPAAPAHQGALAARLALLVDEPAVGPGTREDAFLAPAAWFPKDEGVEAPAAREAVKADHALTVGSVLTRDRKVLSAVVDGKILWMGKPARNDSVEGKGRTYELVQASIDARGIIQMQVRVNDALFEVTKEDRSGKQ